MVTSAYIDFIIDPDIFKIHNRSRNRRLFFVGSLVLGSFTEAIGYKLVSPAPTLYLLAAGKALVCIVLLFNPEGSREIDGTPTHDRPAAASRGA